MIGAIDVFIMPNGVCLCARVLMKGDDHALRRAMNCAIDHLRKKGRWKRTWKGQVVKEECVKVGLSREGGLCISWWLNGVNHVTTRLM